MANYKTPPVFKEDISYEAWKKEFAIWNTFTDLYKKKQEPTIFLSLNGKPSASVLELDVGVTSGGKGVEAILEQLHKLYLKDRLRLLTLPTKHLKNFNVQHLCQ